MTTGETSRKKLVAEPNEHVPYFLPKVDTAVGTAIGPKSTGNGSSSGVPELFTPLRIKNMEIANRIGVSPMVTYSGGHEGPDIGKPTDFHLIHYGALSLQGPGLIIVESTTVSPQSSASPEDLRIYTDEQALEFKRIVQFAHSQGVKIGIQFGHGGRKASGAAMFLHPQQGVNKDEHGWSDIPGSIVSPSAIRFNERYATPAELTLDQIKDIIEDYKKASIRARKIAGFDFIEIHAAHGYLVSSFLSSTTNQRTDEYGGSFENRIRFLLEIIEAVQDNDTPLFVRVSGSELTPNDPKAWTIEDTIKLSDYLIDHGVDVLDVSSGGINAQAERRRPFQGYQVPLAKAVKAHVGHRLTVATVGRIDEAEYANQVISNGEADIVLVGRQFLKNPSLVWKWADDLNTRITHAKQYEWPYYPAPFT